MQEAKPEENPFHGMPREPIPEILHSFYEERSFLCCTRCGESLAEFSNGYKVAKHFRKGEVTIEYALCMPCIDRMMTEASEHSRHVLNEFQQKRFRHISGFNDCALCEKTQETARDSEFSLTGICHGKDMVDSAMVCVECMEEMSEIISEETRGKWNRFREENFPGVPGDFQPMPEKPVPVEI